MPREVVPAPAPAVPDALRLVRVTTEARVTQLGAEMGNCLATYGRGRLRGRDRLYEVHRGNQLLYAVHVRDGRIVQFEAARNRRPDEADIPVVRRLLETERALEATRSAAASAAASSARRTTRARADRQAGRPQRARRQTRPQRPRQTRQDHLSIQGLAAAYLGRDRDRPDWTEVATALWLGGLLPNLPAPEDVTWERIVRDLAAAVVTGTVPDAARRPPPGQQDREAAAQRLRAEAGASGGPRRTEDFQRIAMAGVLVADVRD